MVSKQSLAVALSQLQPFAAADIRLEQYPTDSEIASELLWEAHMRGHLAGKRVLDLGAGTGILAIGAAILGAQVTAVEMDVAAVTVLRENADVFEGVEVEIRVGDVESYASPADTVVMNPPFGTKERHADRVFLERAFALAPIVYSIHKSATAPFIDAFSKDHGFNIAWRAERRLPIKRTMAHHEKARKFIEVTIYRFERK